MISTTLETQNGANPLKSRRGVVASGPQPRRGPPLVTGGPLTSSWTTRGRGVGERVTGRDEAHPRHVNIVHWNAEGVYNKKVALTERLKQEDIDIFCMQETHLKDTQRFGIRGYQVFRLDRVGRTKGGTAILVRNSIPAQEIVVNTANQSEIHGVTVSIDNMQLRIFNAYCPQDKELSLESMEILDNQCLIVGDFNSHSETWGYQEADKRGEEVEDWQIEHNLILVNEPDDPPTFFSRRWLTTTTPDLAFATDDIAKKITRRVLDQLGGSDHKPVKLSLNVNFVPTKERSFPRWNFKKAKWKQFSKLTDENVKGIHIKNEHLNHKIKAFNQAILKAAAESIPRGSRRNYKPYWTEEYQDKEDKVTEARDKVEEDPSMENNIALKAATAELRKTYIQEARRSWHEKTDQLNLDKEGNKLWKLTRALNDEGNKSAPITLLHNEEVLTGKKAADRFMEQYAETSKIPITDNKRRETKEALKVKGKEDGVPEMNSPFTRQELEEAMASLKLKKSPGPDKIHNEMLIHLGPKAQKKLLQIFNDSWRSGLTPQTWKVATMIPVYKKGKDKTKAVSYRPISLLSCIGKLMERLVNNRLVWYLEEKKLISPEQAAFRTDRSTEDQVTYVSQAIEDSFQNKENTITVWVDLEKAFDKVWKEGLKLKMKQIGVAGKMYKWICQHLHNRTARTQVGKFYSRKRILEQGVPQGGVLSPTLFLIFVNDIIIDLPPRVKGAIYADDLALWCSAEDIRVANGRLQQALTDLEAWTKKWLVNINERKTTYTVFSLSNRNPKIKLQINGQPLQEEGSPTYLGVTLDKRLTWKNHINKTQTQAKKRLGLMKKLSGTQWGADQRVLKTLYVGRIQPVLEYGMASTSAAAKSHSTKLTRIQNQAMRVMTGAMKTTPIDHLETTTGLTSLESRREQKVLVQAAKFKRLEDHPMHRRMRQPTRIRLKRSCFVKTSRKFERQHNELQDHVPKPIPSVVSIPSWKRPKWPQINSGIPGIKKKGTQSDMERKLLALEYIHSTYPKDKWTHAYTDGSATDATKNGGGGIQIEYNDDNVSIAMPTGKYSTNYRAEAAALREASISISQNTTKTKMKVVIFTDALSVLQRLNRPSKDLNHLVDALTEICNKTQLTLQWIPAHCGLQGNEKADQLAKEGGNMNQEDKQVAYSDEKTHIKTSIQRKWKQRHPNHDPSDSYYGLSRGEQVIIFRLRTGHNRLRHHLYNKLKIGDSDKCPCNTDSMTTAHILQECPLHEVTRRNIWPEATPVREKLYGSILALRRTATFIRATRVDI